MSFKCYSIDGYGVDTTKIHWKSYLLPEIKELVNGTKFGKDLLKEIDDNPDTDFLEIIEQCAEDWSCIYNSPLEFVIASVINEKEGLELEAFSRDDYGCSYVCVTPFYPFKGMLQGKLESQEWYDNIFKKYFSYLTDDEIEFGYYSAYYSG